jgi:hypothetical protein
LQTAALIDLVKNYDRLEFDITAAPSAAWSVAWVSMDGDGFNWSLSAPIELSPGQTTHVSIDMAAPDPSAPSSSSWKAGAAASGGAWWRLTFALQGSDTASSETFTIIDNVRFARAVPEPNAFCLAIAAVGAFMLNRRNAIGRDFT